MNLAKKALIIEEYVGNGLSIKEISEKHDTTRQYVAIIIRLYFSKKLEFASTRSKYETYKKLQIAQSTNLVITNLHFKK